MIIAGVDPGIQNTGIAAIKVTRCQIELVGFELIETLSNERFELRLKTISDNVTAFLKQYQPEELALEEIFYSRNVKVALKMGHARGVTLLAAANFGIPVMEYSPREVKLAATGNGNASKHQVQQMVCHILKITHGLPNYDVTDAMAVAYCHAQRTKI